VALISPVATRSLIPDVALDLPLVPYVD
jgi:hypothetical protein